MRRVSLWMLMAAWVFFASACAMHNVAATDQSPAATSADTSGSGASGAGAGTSADTSASAGSSDQSASTAPVPPPTKMVAGFNDIPVPADLTRDDKHSFIYEAPSVTMGVIIYTGYDKGASVARFFRTEMPNYGWQFLNAFSEGNTYMVAFLKANRSCIINIEQGTLSTTVTIKVGPTQAGTGGAAGAGTGAGANPNPPLHYEVGQ